MSRMAIMVLARYPVFKYLDPQGKNVPDLEANVDPKQLQQAL